MKKVFLLIIILGISVTMLAKRTAPPRVSDIVWNDSIVCPYAQNNVIGLLWLDKKKSPQYIPIYEITKVDSIEKDIQLIYISKIVIVNDIFIMGTEQGGVFSYDPTTNHILLIKQPNCYKVVSYDKQPIQLEFEMTASE